MTVAELDSKTLKFLENHESQLVKALQVYYSNFGNEDKAVTFNQAAHMQKLNPAYLVDFIFQSPVRIGIPETREEALEYLGNLIGHYEKKSS